MEDRGRERSWGGGIGESGALPHAAPHLLKKFVTQLAMEFDRLLNSVRH
jgi:hypothetical protein